jgi:hypothetical protein
MKRQRKEEMRQSQFQKREKELNDCEAKGCYVCLKISMLNLQS